MNFLKLTLKYLFLGISFFILVSCASPQAKNNWQYEAVRMTNAYQKHFLQAKISRANLDVQHAKKLSKQSANLQTLIDVELTICAMHVSILSPINCDNASTLLKVQPDLQQKAYLSLLNNSLDKQDIHLLPQQYQDFAKALKNTNSKYINKEINAMQPISSKLIASSLAQPYINNENISSLIKELSFLGYKNPLISWLQVQESRETKPQEKIRIRAKIEVLLSK